MTPYAGEGFGGKKGGAQGWADIMTQTLVNK